MQTINISLPEQMTQYIEDQVTAGSYNSASGNVYELIRADQKRQAKNEFEQVLLSALGSGDPTYVTPKMVEDARDRFHLRADARQR